jgi:hypothetical protein
MLNLVLEAAAVSLSGISPVVLGDELAEGAIGGQKCGTFCFEPQRSGRGAGAKGIFRLDNVIVDASLNAVGHRHAGIFFVEGEAGDGGNRELRHEFADKDRTAL